MFALTPQRPTCLTFFYQLSDPSDVRVSVWVEGVRDVGAYPVWERQEHTAGGWGVWGRGYVCGLCEGGVIVWGRICV